MTNIKLSISNNKMIEYLKNNYPFIITASIALFWFIRFLFIKYEEYVSLHKHKNNLDEKILPSIEERLKPIPRMDERISLLYNKGFGKKITETKSPIQLGSEGKELANDLDSYKLIEKYKDKFINKIENINELNPYRIQEECKKIIDKYFKQVIDNNDLIIIENKAFKEGILFDDLMPIYSIILRDEILKNRDIDIKNIDKYDPNKKK